MSLVRRFGACLVPKVTGEGQARVWNGLRGQKSANMKKKKKLENSPKIKKRTQTD